MNKRSIAEVAVHGKRVLMRVDFNVPLEDGEIADDMNLRLALPSIRNVLDRGGRLILLTHLGVPEGRGFEPALSLTPCAQRLRELLHRPVQLAPNCVGPQVGLMVQQLRNGDLLMLENLRFHRGEIGNEESFAQELAEWGDVYCNEAFGVSHRQHASLDALPRLMWERPRVAGLQLIREVTALKAVCEHPLRPSVLVIGGAHAPEKCHAVLGLRDCVDTVLIGGVVGHTFLAAERKSVGRTEADPHDAMAAERALEAAVSARAKVMLPNDHVCATQISGFADTHVYAEVIPSGWYGLDIGPRTIVAYAEVIRHARTVFWTGPLGAWETRPFDVGTKMIALAAAHAVLINHAQVIIAGGSLRLALERFGLDRSMTHLNSGGSATLAMLEHQPFPSLDALEERNESLSTTTHG